MTNEQRQKIERQIVRKVIRAMKAAGYLPSQVWDGGEYVSVSNETETLDAVFAVDSATIHFDGGAGNNGKSHGVLCVLGNGFDVLSDWHIGDKVFAEVMDKVCDEVSAAELS